MHEKKIALGIAYLFLILSIISLSLGYDIKENFDSTILTPYYNLGNYPHCFAPILNYSVGFSCGYTFTGIYSGTLIYTHNNTVTDKAFEFRYNGDNINTRDDDFEVIVIPNIQKKITDITTVNFDCGLYKRSYPTENLNLLYLNFRLTNGSVYSYNINSSDCAFTTTIHGYKHIRFNVSSHPEIQNQYLSNISLYANLRVGQLFAGDYDNLIVDNFSVNYLEGNYLPEIKRVDIMNDGVAVINQFNFSELTMNVTATDAENNTIYYATDCNFHNANQTYLIPNVDTFPVGQYKMQYDGWMNGSCDYNTAYKGYVVGNVLEFNSSSCISDIKKHLDVAPISNDFEIEWLANTYLNPLMIFEIQSSSNTVLFDVSMKPNITTGQMCFYYSDGSDVLVKCVNANYNGYFIRLQFDMTNHKVKYYISTDFHQSFTFLGEYPFLNNEPDADYFYVNPYTYYAGNTPNAFIDTIILTQSNPLPPYDLTNKRLCEYPNVIEQYTVRNYVTDSVHPNDYSVYHDSIITTVEKKNEGGIEGDKGNLNDEFDSTGKTGIWLILSQLIWFIQFPARFLNTLGMLQLANWALVVAIIIYFVIEIFEHADLKVASIKAFTALCVFAILGISYREIFMLFAFLFAIYMASDVGGQATQEGGHTSFYVKMYAIFITIMILSGIVYQNQSGFKEIVLPAKLTVGSVAQLTSDIIMLMLSIIFYTPFTNELNFFNIAIILLINAVLWSFRAIIFFENIKNIKEIAITALVIAIIDIVAVITSAIANGVALFHII